MAGRIGVYSLVGASAMLGGMARITISLTVILIECTNDVQYGLPIMVTVMFAKWVGDLFNEGLYDIHIHLKGVPFLEPGAEDEMDAIRVEDLMARDPQTLPGICRVADLIDLLQDKNFKHHHFPVVSEAEGHYIGMMKRELLCEMLSWRKGDGQPKLFQAHDGNCPDIEPWGTVQVKYPIYIGLQEAIQDLTQEHRQMFIDLRPYMNRNAYTLRRTALVTRAYTLFRGMGLRCLPILEDGGRVCGVITREDLLHDALHEGLVEAEHQRPHEFEQSVFSHSPRNSMDSERNPTTSQFGLLANDHLSEGGGYIAMKH